jgi:hypothetical protein
MLELAHAQSQVFESVEVVPTACVAAITFATPSFENVSVPCARS